MSVSRYRSASDGRSVNIKSAPKAASTVIAQDELLTYDASGNLVPASTTSIILAGVSMVSVKSTDDNYATNDEIQYDEPLEGDEFIMDVDNASTAGFVPGVTRAILDSKTVKAAADTTNKNFVVVKKVLTADNKAIVTFLTNG